MSAEATLILRARAEAVRRLALAVRLDDLARARALAAQIEDHDRELARLRPVVAAPVLADVTALDGAQGVVS